MPFVNGGLWTIRRFYQALCSGVCTMVFFFETENMLYLELCKLADFMSYCYESFFQENPNMRFHYRQERAEGQANSEPSLPTPLQLATT